MVSMTPHVQEDCAIKTTGASREREMRARLQAQSRVLPAFGIRMQVNHNVGDTFPCFTGMLRDPHIRSAQVRGL